MATQSAPRQRFYDVVIIGAGVSGALAAEAVSALPLKILVVDRRSPASGSTSACTALIQWEVDQPLSGLIKKVGIGRAKASYRATYRALRSLRRLITGLRLECSMTPRKTLLLAGNKMGEKALRGETRLRRSIDLPSRFLEPDKLKKLYGFDRDGAIESSGNLELDPRRLTFELLAVSESRGVEIVAPANVTRISPCESGVFITLDESHIIAAGKVIAATGYEALPEIPDYKFDLISTWALATIKQTPQLLWKDRVLVWEAADPYLYFRTTPDNRIIAGGEDTAFRDAEKRDALTKKKAARILAKLSQLLPEAKLEPQYMWSGTFAESPTGLPVIGPMPDMPNVFAILGAGGNGVTYSVIAAKLAKAWVKGVAHPQAKLFAVQ